MTPATVSRLLNRSDLPAAARPRESRVRLVAPVAAPPLAIVEERSFYVVVFNMLGVGKSGIGIDVNPLEREVTVVARKADERARSGFYWVFGVPADGRLADLSARYQGGALEIRIPKRLGA